MTQEEINSEIKYLEDSLQEIERRSSATTILEVAQHLEERKFFLERIRELKYMISDEKRAEIGRRFDRQVLIVVTSTISTLVTIVFILRWLGGA